MIEINKLRSLYWSHKKSMQETAKILNCSVHKVQYWMKRYNIESRSRSEAIYTKLNPKGDPFNIKRKLNGQDLLLLGVGLGLWWGEGTKRNCSAVRLGNSDPQLILKFMEFLQNICGVQKCKFNFGLQIFSDMDPEEARLFWINILQVEPKQFYPKIIITKSGKAGTYKAKTKHGVLTLYVNNIKLRRALDDLMNQYLGYIGLKNF